MTSLRRIVMCGNSLLFVVMMSFTVIASVVADVAVNKDDQAYLDTLAEISKETADIERLLKDNTQQDIDNSELPPPDDTTVTVDDSNEETVNENEGVSDILFGGDMRLTPEQVQLLKGKPLPAGVSSDLMKQPSNHWPKGQPVPYMFDPRFTDAGKRAVFAAIEEYKQKTCIRFVQRTNQKGYIYFYNGAGCWSFVGRTGGRQMISLQARGCEHKGIAIHEIMHALGYFHEQSRPDRDQHITVHFDNIIQRAKNNFKKLTTSQSDNQNTAYDLASIMHYGTHGFAINRNKPTISVLRRGATIGQRRGLSTIDALSLNKLYCNGVQPRPSPSTTTTTPAPRPNGSDRYQFCSEMKGAGLCLWCIVRNNWCPKTCSGQGTVQRDRRRGCEGIKKFCTSGMYRNYMSRNCAKTCDKAVSQMRCK